MAEEGGLDLGPEPGETGRGPSRLAGLMHGLADGFLTAPPDEFGNPSPLGEVGVHGVPRARRWDVVASARAELPVDEVHFSALPDGTLIVEEDVPDGSLTPLAEAIEVTLNPPYRAEAVKREDGVWAVAARRIGVREFPEAEGGRAGARRGRERRDRAPPRRRSVRGRRDAALERSCSRRPRR